MRISFINYVARDGIESEPGRRTAGGIEYDFHDYGCDSVDELTVTADGRHTSVIRTAKGLAYCYEDPLRGRRLGTHQRVSILMRRRATARCRVATIFITREWTIFGASRGGTDGGYISRASILSKFMNPATSVNRQTTAMIYLTCAHLKSPLRRDFSDSHESTAYDFSDKSARYRCCFS